MADDIQTKWLGLWKQESGVYTSCSFKKADIPAHSRIVIRKNKFYVKDSNRPQFVFCFASGDSLNALTIERSKNQYFQDLEDKFNEGYAEGYRRGYEDAKFGY